MRSWKLRITLQVIHVIADSIKELFSASIIEALFGAECVYVLIKS
jgi:hypothetical protein